MEQTTSSAAQQVNPSNHCQGNPSNLFPNSAQIQCQMGMMSPQIATPFNNFNTHLGNGPGAMPNRPIWAPVGSPNHPLPLQNGMPLMGSASGMSHLGQFPGAFGAQNTNSMPMAPMILIQLPSHFPPHNSVNPPQYLSQNAVVLNGQLCLQNPMQNINQFVQIPMSNYTQVVPCNMQQYPNQVSQALAHQNPAFLANAQFGPVHSTAVVHTSNRDQHSTVAMNAKTQSHTPTQQSQTNSPLPPGFGSVLPQQSHKDFLPQQSHKDFHPPVSIVHSTAVVHTSNRDQHSTVVMNAKTQSHTPTQQSQTNSPLPPGFGSVLPQQSHKDFLPQQSHKDFHPPVSIVHSTAVVHTSNRDQHSTVVLNAKTQSHTPTQQSQTNSPLPPGFGSVLPQQSHKDFLPQQSHKDFHPPVSITSQQHPNQVSQVLAPQNSAFLGNPQFGPVHSTAVVHTSNEDQHKPVPSTMVVNATRQSHAPTQQSQRNKPLPPGFGSVLPHQIHKDFYPPVSTKSQQYPNQVFQALAPQNPTFLANPQFRPVHSTAVVHTSNRDQQKLVPPMMVTNAKRQSHTPTQQSQRNSPLPPGFGSVLPQQTHKDFYPPVSTKSQENLKKDGGIINLNSNWKNTQNRNFKQNRRNALHQGFPKSQFHNMQNTKGKFRFHNKYRGKGYENDWAKTCEHSDTTNQTSVGQRRSISLNYTEQEIRQWREERKKNYPSKYNIEKKLAEKLTEPEVMQRDAKFRRQQLKEILAKQAELGCEVAEIPSGYLSDSEKQGQGKELDKRTSAKKERFQNKFNKRGRFGRNQKFSKKQRLADHDSSNVPNQDDKFSHKPKLTDDGSCTKPSFNKKQPTLLQRLLSADMRREKHHLLQVFRFMVMNSFFKDWPENPLIFPSVVVKDTAAQGEVIVEKPLSSGKGTSQTHGKTIIGESEYDVYHGDRGADDEDDENRNDKRIAQVKDVHFANLKGSSIEGEEEEGEIID